MPRVSVSAPRARPSLAEVLFYHLQGQTLEEALPSLLERSLARGWRVVVQAASAERIEALDAHLWTYRDDSFLPHGTDRERDGAEQPIVLTLGDGNPNGANIRFLLEGADLPPDIARYERVVLLFDGGDAEAVAAARLRWKDVKARGFEATYWRQNEAGRWEPQG